jgi:hypothetical protein
MKQIGVDPDCVELARAFLVDAHTEQRPSDKEIAADIKSLSEAIQTAIEDWFTGNSRCVECHINPADPPSPYCPGCEAYREHTR